MKINIEDAKKVIGGVSALGSGPVLKALGKFIPGIGSFVSGAYTAGYAADQILDFVKDKLESPAQRRNKAQLESRAEQGVARADEKANLSQMEQQQSPANALMGLGNLAAQGAGGAASAGASAAQQQQEQAMREQAKQQQEEQQNAQMAQQQQDREEKNKRQAQQDQLATIRQQSVDIRNRESSERLGRAEERAIEKHKMTLGKSAVKAGLKKKVPETHGDILRELYELANRAP
jgi:hypothetical protein